MKIVSTLIEINERDCENMMLCGVPKEDSRYYEGKYQDEVYYHLITSKPSSSDDEIIVRYRAVNDFWKEHLYLEHLPLRCVNGIQLCLPINQYGIALWVSLDGISSQTLLEN